MQGLHDFPRRSVLGLVILIVPLLLGVPASAVEPPPNVSFPGGSLDDLRATSPTLQFGRLVITGSLVIDLNNDGGASEIRIVADEFEIASSGRIGRTQSACSYLDSPDLEILAGTSVVLDGSIDLSGKRGDRENEFTTCNRCRGRDGGDLLIRGREIAQNDAIISNGGGGSTSEFRVSGTTFRSGCSGGDAGDIRLEAGVRVSLAEEADFLYRAGSGGTGNSNGSDGADGEAGHLDLVAPDIAVSESEPNGSAARAQELLLAPLELSGFVDSGDDAAEPDPVFVNFIQPGPPPDRQEDLYEIEVLENGLALVRLDIQNSSTDIDIYLLDGVTGNVVAQSNDPAGASESFQVGVGPGTYFLGVSWCCNTPGSNYTLGFGPLDPAPAVPPSGLTEVDLFSAGDALATLDDVSGLLWLDVTATVNRSFDAVSAGAGGWSSLGFRPATAGEVCALLGRYATVPRPCPSFLASAVSADLVTRFQQLFGITFLTATSSTLRATFDGSGGDSVGLASLRFAGGSSTASVSSEAQSPTVADPRLGHFLVRPVPEPSAAALAAAALATLELVRRRSRRRGARSHLQ